MNSCCCVHKNICQCNSTPKGRSFLGKVAITGGIYLFIYFLYRLHKKQQATGLKEHAGAKLLFALLLWSITITCYCVDKNPSHNFEEKYVIPSIVGFILLFT